MVFIGSPAASIWGGTSYTWDIFARSPEGILLYKWYTSASWTGWDTSLGGGLIFDPAALVWDATLPDSLPPHPSPVAQQ